MCLPEEYDKTDEEEDEGSDADNNDDTGHVEDVVDIVDAGDDWIVATIPLSPTVWYSHHPRWWWRWWHHHGRGWGVASNVTICHKKLFIRLHGKDMLRGTVAALVDSRVLAC